MNKTDSEEKFDDFLEELSDYFHFEYSSKGSSVGEPCFMTDLCGEKITSTISEKTFEKTLVFFNFS